MSTGMIPESTQDPFEPWDYDRPAERLVLPLRSLGLGKSLTVARGVVIKAVAVQHGASKVRRYHVGGGGSRQTNSEQQRHDGTVKSASEAAHLAVELSKGLGRPSSQVTD